MNSRAISLLLLVVNLVLLATIAWMVFAFPQGPGAALPFPRTRVVTNTVTQIAVRKINATNHLLAALANRPLSWLALESTNYAVYIDNLRDFGCPEETIRDIIITDVAKLFAKRRAALRAQAQPYKFWQTDDLSGVRSTPPELHKQLRELDRGQRALIQELLGVDYRAELAKYWAEDDSQERQFGFLPAARQEKLKSFLEQFDEAEQEIYLRTKGVMLDEDHAALRKLRQQRDAELAQLLTPEEMEEYHLRNSDTANSLRAQLSGFEPTEDEFRKIFRFQKSLDDTFNESFTGFDASDDAKAEAYRRAQADAQAALNDEVKKTLGEKRFAEYQRAQDGDYKALLQFAERFELPKEVTGKIYDMKAEAERQRQQLEFNPNLTDEQRQKALAAIARETERSVVQVMGGKLFKSYQKSSGQWINNLGFSPEILPPPEIPPPQ